MTQAIQTELELKTSVLDELFKQGRIKKATNLANGKAEINANFALTKEGYYMSFPCFDTDDDMFHLVYDLAVQQIKLEQDKVRLATQQNSNRRVVDILIWFSVLFGMLSITMTVVLLIMLAMKPEAAQTTASAQTTHIEDTI